MKKFLTGLFVLILIVAGGVGGFFIGQSYANNTLTIDYVGEELTTICKSAGWLKEEEDKNEQSQPMLNVAYTEDTVDFNGYDQFTKAFVLFAKFVFEDENLKEETFYVSESSYTMFNQTVNGKMGCYFTMERSLANIWLYDFNADCTVKLVLDNSLQSGEIGVLQIYSTKLPKSLQDGIFYGELRANTEKVTGFSYIEMTTAESDLSKIEKANVTNMSIYDCDLVNKKQKSLTLNELTDDEFETYKNAAINEFDKVYFISFGKAKFLKSNALENLYKEMGYTIVEQ